MRILLPALLILALTAPTAAAQCNLGVYAEPEGTGGWIRPSTFLTFHVYVVLFVEDSVNAVAYRLLGDELFDPVTNPDGTIIIQGVTYGPEGDGINVETPGGDNVGLGLCSNGIDGVPVLVADYTLLYTGLSTTTYISVDRNTDYGSILYSTCDGVVKDCDVGPSLLIDDLVTTEAPSWGAVKNLYSAN
jgi:hypothetical protein